TRWPGRRWSRASPRPWATTAASTSKSPSCCARSAACCIARCRRCSNGPDPRSYHDLGHARRAGGVRCCAGLPGGTAMDLPYDKLIKLIWLAFALCWLWYARRAKAVQRRESPGLRFAKYWLPLIAAGALLGPGDWYGSGDAGLKWQWLPESDAVRLLG